MFFSGEIDERVKLEGGLEKLFKQQDDHLWCGGGEGEKEKILALIYNQGVGGGGGGWLES